MLTHNQNQPKSLPALAHGRLEDKAQNSGRKTVKRTISTKRKSTGTWNTLKPN
jgi:hypothetical protein